MPYGQAPYPPRQGLLAPQATGAPMGLLGGQIQPKAWAGKFGNFTQDNSALLTMLGLGLLDKRQNNQVPFSQIGQQALVGQKLDKERKTRKQTALFLQTKYGLSPQEADAAADNPAVLASILRPDPNEGASVYGTPIWGKVGDKTVLGVIGKNGTFQTLDTGGVTLTPGVDNLNLGTSFLPVDRSGTAAAPAIPIDVRGQAAEEKIGAGQGEATVSFESINSKLPGLTEVVGKLDDLANKATYTATGQLYDEIRRQTGQEPREAAVARAEYQGTVRNVILPLLRDTFGAQFTEREGQVLLATLGDPNSAPAEKQAALKAFIEQKVRDLQGLSTQSGRPFTPPSQPGAPSTSEQQRLRNKYGLE